MSNRDVLSSRLEEALPSDATEAEDKRDRQPISWEAWKAPEADYPAEIEDSRRNRRDLMSDTNSQRQRAVPADVTNGSASRSKDSLTVRRKAGSGGDPKKKLVSRYSHLLSLPPILYMLCPAA